MAELKLSPNVREAEAKPHKEFGDAGTNEQILAAELEKAIVRGDTKMVQFFERRLFEETMRESPGALVSIGLHLYVGFSESTEIN